MTSINGGGNYVSDGDITAWLALQQDRVYGDLRDSMDLGQRRADFVDALNDIKTELHNVNKTDQRDFSGVDAKLQELLKTYGNDPEFAELCQGLNQLADPIHQRVNAFEQNARQREAYTNAVKDFVDSGGNMNGPSVQNKVIKGVLQTLNKPIDPGQLPNIAYDDDQLKIWDDLIGGKLDVLNKNDQLNMIHIQQLKALADQGTQLGSQFIGSGDKATSAIINNIA